MQEKRIRDDLINRQAAIDAIDKALSRTFAEPCGEMILKDVPSAQPEIIHCKDCKHRPKATRADEKVFYGFSVKFPDEKCPCYCEDGWYGWYPEDDFYCGNAERREV